MQQYPEIYHVVFVINDRSPQPTVNFRAILTRVESRRRHFLTLTLLRRGRIIHGATYFEDADQRSPVRDVATIVQYDTIAARSCSHGAQPTTVPRHCSLCPQTDLLMRQTFAVLSKDMNDYNLHVCLFVMCWYITPHYCTELKFSYHEMRCVSLIYIFKAINVTNFIRIGLGAFETYRKTKGGVLIFFSEHNLKPNRIEPNPIRRQNPDREG